MERNAGLQEGVTDGSLQALAAAGCGKNLTSLTLWCECLFLLLSLAFFRVLFFLLCRVWLYPLSDVASLLSPFPSTRSLPLHALSRLPVSLSSHSADKRMERNADLRQGVTDGSLQALAEAGCGKNLTSLTLRGECLFFFCLLFSSCGLVFFCAALGPPCV